MFWIEWNLQCKNLIVLHGTRQHDQFGAEQKQNQGTHVNMLLYIPLTLHLVIHNFFVDYCIFPTDNFTENLNHFPGALLVSILPSKKTWRTRNAARSSNDDCEKTTQHFAMMSESDFLLGIFFDGQFVFPIYDVFSWKTSDKVSQCYS